MVSWSQSEFYWVVATLKLKSRLGLNAIRKESVSLNVFGSQEGIEFTALCFPSICSPLSRVVTLGQHPEFQELELADLPPLNGSSRHDNGTIDVLIGSDHYWGLFVMR